MSEFLKKPSRNQALKSGVTKPRLLFHNSRTAKFFLNSLSNTWSLFIDFILLTLRLILCYTYHALPYIQYVN
jgi:hypothetical protein